MAKRPISKTQIKVLRQVLDSKTPLRLSGKFRRTVNSLVRAGLVTSEYITDESKYYDEILVRQKASDARVRRAIQGE